MTVRPGTPEKGHRYVAFLRAINVGGRVGKMAALKGLFERLKLADVETFIASGNVIFTSASDAQRLERLIEGALEKVLGQALTLRNANTGCLGSGHLSHHHASDGLKRTMDYEGTLRLLGRPSRKAGRSESFAVAKYHGIEFDVPGVLRTGHSWHAPSLIDRSPSPIASPSIAIATSRQASGRRCRPQAGAPTSPRPSASALVTPASPHAAPGSPSAVPGEPTAR